jgi:hypothetical protein
MEVPSFTTAMNATASKRDAPAAVLMTNLLKPPCPAVTRKGPEAGNLIIRFSWFRSERYGFMPVATEPENLKR